MAALFWNATAPIAAGRVDDVIVGNRQELCLAVFEPSPRGGRLALGAVTIPAGVVCDALVRAVLAALDMSAERGCATGGRGSRDRRWPFATPPRGRERHRRPRGEAAPRGRGQAGGVRFVSLMSSRSSGLLMSRTVLMATRV